MIETAPFGETGHRSTRVIFGAAALASVSQVEADRALEVLLGRGINHIDTAASYGESELRLAPWLREHRDRFFLATKTGERSYGAARDEIRRSLDRMGVDRVEARDEGLVRFIGVTGHGLTVAEMHRRSLERFPFDAVLLPFSHVIVRDPQYARDVERLLSSCRERGVAVQTIKGIARGPWGSSEHSAATWYEPLTDQDDIDLAVHWVLGEPDVFLNSPGDLDLLPRVLDAAERFESRPGEAAMAALLEGRRLSSLFI